MKMSGVRVSLIAAAVALTSLTVPAAVADAGGFYTASHIQFQGQVRHARRIGGRQRDFGRFGTSRFRGGRLGEPFVHRPYTGLSYASFPYIGLPYAIHPRRFLSPGGFGSFGCSPHYCGGVAVAGGGFFHQAYTFHHSPQSDFDAGGVTARPAHRHFSIADSQTGSGRAASHATPAGTGEEGGWVFSQDELETYLDAEPFNVGAMDTENADEGAEARRCLMFRFQGDRYICSQFETDMTVK